MAEVSGTMTSKDVKRLSRALRTGTIGPTTVYYAGVTAPIISAGVGVFARQTLHNADFISGYWLWFISTLIAAFAGICWYLIFIRWSYRNTYGRGDETGSEAHIELSDAGIVVTRKFVTTTIAWDGVEDVRRKENFSAIITRSSDPVLIPDHWFKENKSARDDFYKSLAEYVKR